MITAYLKYSFSLKWNKPPLHWQCLMWDSVGVKNTPWHSQKSWIPLLQRKTLLTSEPSNQMQLSGKHKHRHISIPLALDSNLNKSSRLSATYFILASGKSIRSPSLFSPLPKPRLWITTTGKCSIGSEIWKLTSFFLPPWGFPISLLQQ